jgi:hypothetical protein
LIAFAALASAANVSLLPWPFRKAAPSFFQIHHCAFTRQEEAQHENLYCCSDAISPSPAGLPTFAMKAHWPSYRPE